MPPPPPPKKKRKEVNDHFKVHTADGSSAESEGFISVVYTDKKVVGSNPGAG